MRAWGSAWVLACAACSSSGAAPGANADAGLAADAVAQPDAVDAPSASAHTSATCGGIVVGGAQAPNNSAACVACVNAQCCAQATACAPGNACTDYDTCRDRTCNTPCSDVSCVGSVVWLTPAKTSYDLALTLNDFQDGTPVSGATVKVCGATDVACAAPSSTATTNAAGLVMVTVPSAPSGVDGYMEISGTGLETTLVYFTIPDPNALFFVHDPQQLGSQVLRTATFQAFAAMAGVTLDPTRGHLALEAFDCSLYPLSGVSFAASTADANSHASYLLNGVPSTAMQTDGSGLAAILDLPTGMTQVTSTQGGTKIGTTTVIVRAGAVTALTLSPTP